MIKVTPLKIILTEAKFKTINEAATYFNYSLSTFAKIVAGSYKLKKRMKEYIVFKLSKRLKRDVSINEVFK